MTHKDSGVSYGAFRPYPFGGGNNLAFGLSLDQASDLDELHLVVSRRHPTDWRFLRRGRIHVHELNSRQPPVGASFVGTLLRYKEIVDALDVADVAELSNPFSAQVLSYARRRGKRTITTVIETCIGRVIDRLPPHRAYTETVKRCTDRFRVLTLRSKSYLVSMGIEAEKIDVIPIGIDRSLFYPSRDSRGDDRYRILLARRLERKNGFLDLLRVLPDLARLHPRPELWIAGEGPLRKKLETSIRTVPVKFLGNLRYDELASVYRQVDVYCNPAHDTKLLGQTIQEDGQYTFPLLEAQACGLPVITTSSGSNDELLAPHNLQIPQSDPLALLEAIARLSDTVTRNMISRENASFIESRFDCTQLQAKFDRLVFSLVNKSGMMDDGKDFAGAALGPRTT